MEGTRERSISKLCFFFLEELNYIDLEVSPPSPQPPSPLDAHFLLRDSWVTINNKTVPPYISYKTRLEHVLQKCLVFYSD